MAHSLPPYNLAIFGFEEYTKCVFLAMQHNTLRKHSLLQTNMETIKHLSTGCLFCIVSLRELFLISAWGTAAIPTRGFPQHVSSGQYSFLGRCLMFGSSKCSYFSEGWCADLVWNCSRDSVSTRWRYKISFFFLEIQRWAAVGCSSRVLLRGGF